MVGSWTTSTLAALALVNTVVHAQTATDCDPQKQSCPANPAMPASFITDFTSTSTSNGKAPEGWFREWCKGDINYNKGKGVDFTYKDVADCDKITTNGYMLFGYVEVKLRAAPGAGIVSTVDMISDTLAEVDLEFVGSGAQANSFQTNWYPNGGDDFKYGRGATLDVDGAYSNYHTYAFNWTASHIDWLLDGKIMRRLTPAEAGPGQFPQVPMRVKIGIWAAGDSNQKGTKEWGGGDIDRSKLPSAMTVQYAKMINYSPAKEYVYTDRSGTWQSIKAVDGTVNPYADDGSAAPPPSPSTGGNGSPSTGGQGSPKNNNGGGHDSGNWGQNTAAPTASGAASTLKTVPTVAPTASNIQKPVASGSTTAPVGSTATTTKTGGPVQQTTNAAPGLSASSGFAMLVLGVVGSLFL